MRKTVYVKMRQQCLEGSQQKGYWDLWGLWVPVTAVQPFYYLKEQDHIWDLDWSSAHETTANWDLFRSNAKILKKSSNTLVQESTLGYWARWAVKIQRGLWEESGICGLLPWEQSSEGISTQCYAEQFREREEGYPFMGYPYFTDKEIELETKYMTCPRPER